MKSIVNSILIILVSMGAAVSCVTSPAAEELDPIPARSEYVVINEVASTGSYEFIELFNLAEAPIVLSGNWVVDDNGEGYGDGARPFIIPEGTLIPGNGYLLICPFTVKRAGEVLNNTDIPQTALCDVSFSVGAHDTARLYHDNVLVDMLSWDTDVNSYGRYPDGSTELTYALQPTPGNPNRLEKRTARNQGIVINEVCSRQDDYVELYNRGLKSYTFPEDTWFIEDAQKQRSIPIPGGLTIPAGGVAVIYTDSGEYSMGLSSADSVYLRFRDEIVDSYSWSEHVESVGRVPDGNDNWLAMEKSPGAANLIPDL